MMKMINKKIIAGISLLLMLSAVGIVIYNMNHHYTVYVIRSNQGWGYDILKGKRLIIHQPFMPAINGQIAFRKKEAAKKTGLLIVKKLQNKISPRIEVNELDSIIRDSD
jgi:hypothetical protein